MSANTESNDSIPPIVISSAVKRPRRLLRGIVTYLVVLVAGLVGGGAAFYGIYRPDTQRRNWHSLADDFTTLTKETFETKQAYTGLQKKLSEASSKNTELEQDLQKEKEKSDKLAADVKAAESKVTVVVQTVQDPPPPPAPAPAPAAEPAPKKTTDNNIGPRFPGRSREI